VIAFHNAGSQFLRSVLIFKHVNKKQEFGDGIPPVLDMDMNRKSSHISTDLFNKSFTKYFLKHKASGKSFYYYMATELIAASLCCFKLLSKITSISFVYRVALLIPYNFG
jgi:hypothetical protein